MAYYGLVQRLILTALIGAAAGTAVAAGWWYVGGERLRRLRPAPRLRRLIVLAAAPLLGAVAMTGIVLLPSILHPMGIAADHCAAHPSHHVHLCLIHGTHGHTDPVGWFVIGFLFLWLGLRAGPVLFEQWRSGRSLAALDAAASSEANGEGRIVESDVPFAVAVGLFAPRLLISDGLREVLSDRQLQIVRAHERVHVRQHHALVQALVELAGLLHLPAVRTYLDDEVGLTCEQIADREAARTVDGEVAVAETILEVEKRLGADHSPAPLSRNAAGAALGGSDLERRVVGLLEEPWRAAPQSRVVVTAVTAVALVAGSYDTVHHGFETFFSILL